MRPCCTQDTHRQQNKPPYNDVGGPQEPAIGEEKQDEVEGNKTGLSLRCPSCEQGYDVALLLPCSHTLCGRCVAAGESNSVGRDGALPPCAVLCPVCCHLVEIPCWEWASATRCLPRNPTLSLGRVRHVSTETLRLSPGSTHYTETAEETEEGSLCALTKDSSLAASVDGAADLRDEEMEQSVLGLSFALDSSGVPLCLHLSHSHLSVTYQGASSPTTGPVVKGMTTTPHHSYITANMVITRGQYYWEVDVCNSSAYRIGVMSSDSSCGWWMERRGLCFCAVYDGTRESVHAVPPHIKTIGVFLNMGGGGLSFHNPLTQEHLATLPTRFSAAGVLPALGLAQGRLRLHCGLPPPPHVFLSRTSAYRQPSGAGWRRWHRDVPFWSVRTVIQKFEELAVSDSDSGLVSSFGSSCSTLAASAEPLHSPCTGGVLHSGLEEQEAELELN